MESSLVSAVRRELFALQTSRRRLRKEVRAEIGGFAVTGGEHLSASPHLSPSAWGGVGERQESRRSQGPAGISALLLLSLCDWGQVTYDSLSFSFFNL